MVFGGLLHALQDALKTFFVTLNAVTHGLHKDKSLSVLIEAVVF